MQSSKVVPLKPTTKLKLVLIPPKEPEPVTQEDVKYFYKKLISIFLENN